jgi:hypothetical protein
MPERTLWISDKGIEAYAQYLESEEERGEVAAAYDYHGPKYG